MKVLTLIVGLVAVRFLASSAASQIKMPTMTDGLVSYHVAAGDWDGTSDFTYQIVMANTPAQALSAGKNKIPISKIT